MLSISVPMSDEGFDEKTGLFVEPTFKVLKLEHSLIALSKWESKWCKAFFSKRPKTDEEIMDYIKCMTINSNIDDDVYNHLSDENVMQINKYLEAPMTATVLPETNSGKASRDTITSELIYYWMISLNIPVEFEKWHINRLLTLIKVFNVKNNTNKKKPRGETIRDYAALNEARRKQFNTKG